MVDLRQGDCLEILKTMPDKSIDFLVTDPPFGLKGEEKIEDVLERLKEADRVCKNMLILMDYRNLYIYYQIISYQYVFYLYMVFYRQPLEEESTDSLF